MAYCQVNVTGTVTILLLFITDFLQTTNSEQHSSNVDLWKKNSQPLSDQFIGLYITVHWIWQQICQTAHNLISKSHPVLGQ